MATTRDDGDDTALLCWDQDEGSRRSRTPNASVDA